MCLRVVSKDPKKKKMLQKLLKKTAIVVSWIQLTN